jgi:hypothetical protein
MKYAMEHPSKHNWDTGESRHEELTRLVKEAPDLRALFSLYRNRRGEFTEALIKLASKRREELESNQEPFDEPW